MSCWFDQYMSFRFLNGARFIFESIFWDFFAAAWGERRSKKVGVIWLQNVVAHCSDVSTEWWSNDLCDRHTDEKNRIFALFVGSLPKRRSKFQNWYIYIYIYITAVTKKTFFWLSCISFPGALLEGWARLQWELARQTSKSPSDHTYPFVLFNKRKTNFLKFLTRSDLRYIDCERNKKIPPSISFCCCRLESCGAVYGKRGRGGAGCNHQSAVLRCIMAAIKVRSWQSSRSLFSESLFILNAKNWSDEHVSIFVCSC